MKNYRMNCIKFTAYKAVRLVVTCLICGSILLSSIAIGDTGSIGAMAIFSLSMFIALLLVKTSTSGKHYSKDGIRIKRIKNV